MVAWGATWGEHAVDAWFYSQRSSGRGKGSAAIRQQETNRATQVAQPAGTESAHAERQCSSSQPMQTDTNQGEFFNQTGQFFNQTGQGPLGTIPVLSEAELTRQDKALTAAYDIFQGIRKADRTTVPPPNRPGERSWL